MCLFACIVGGIYTVIKTKAAVTVEELGDQYFLIGPYNESCVRTEVEITEPHNEAVGRALQQMRDNGVKVSLSDISWFFVQKSA
jgi:glycogen synthase